LDGRMFLCFS